MHLVLFGQTNPANSAATALVHRLVRGGLGVPFSSTTNAVLLLGLWFAVLAAITAALQRDRKRWLQGLIDIRGHFEQVAAGLALLRRNKRPWLLLVAAVFSWTGWSLGVWNIAENKEQLEAMLAQYDNSPTRFAADHALATALVPLRSLTSLADLMPLVVGAAIVLFARTGQMSQALRSRTRAVESVLLKRRLGMVWLGLTVLAAYRAIVFLMAPNAAPMADCLYVNAFLVPALLVAADAVLLSWVVVEMGRAVSYRFEWQPDDSVALVRLLPNAAVTCLLLNAGRYFLVFCAIWQAQFSTPNWPAPRWSVILSICTAAQLFGLAWIGLPAILALHLRGNLRSLLAKYLELLRRAGGQILGLTLLSVAATFLAVLPFYWIFGEMQAETWSLLGAASYGHYMTLLVGIIILATLVQLANQEPGVIEPDELRAVSIPIPLGSPALHQPEAPQ